MGYSGWRDYQKDLKGGNFSSPLKGASLKRSVSFVIAAFLCVTVTLLMAYKPTPQTPVVIKDSIDTKGIYSSIVENLDPHKISSGKAFRPINLDNEKYYLKFSIDEKLQGKMERLLKRYKPPYAAVIGMDPASGKILAMASYSRLDDSDTNWCLKSPFRAASIFKVITSAAAIENLHMGRNTNIGFNGRLYRLNKRNVFDKRRYRNRMTLGTAFAKSANIVFAKLVEHGIKPRHLRQYSEQFLFNQDIPFDFEVESSHASIPEEKYKLAKTAAGFGDVTLSPLHGAIIVSSILNRGAMISPYIVDKIYDENRSLIYQKKPFFPQRLIEEDTALSIKRMMGLTLSRGTIRKTFRGWHRDRVLSKLNIGGKTGSLSSRKLKGQHDWFVGFAEYGDKKLVVSAVIVNHSLWHIKPIYLAKQAFLDYFR